MSSRIRNVDAFGSNTIFGFGLTPALRITTAVAIVATCVASGSLRSAHAAVATLLPPDTSRLHASTRHAIAELRRIVAARDLVALERHIAPDATMSFGPGSTGAAGLREV